VRGKTLRLSVQHLKVSEEAICWAGQFDEKLSHVLQLGRTCSMMLVDETSD
jgi:TolB-like protein